MTTENQLRIVFAPNTVAQVLSYRAVVDALQEATAPSDILCVMLCPDNDPRGREAEKYCRQHNVPHARLGDAWSESDLKHVEYRMRMQVLAEARAEIDEIIDLLHPQVAVIPYDVEGTPSILLQQAAARGIPTLLLQDSMHGLEPVPLEPDGTPLLNWPRHYPWASVHYGHGGATRIAVSGARIRDKMVREGIPESTIVMTGQPRWDAVARGRTWRPGLRPDPSSLRVLYVCSPTTRRSMSEPHVARFVVEETLKAFPLAHVTVKLHPSETISDYAALARSLPQGSPVTITDEAETGDLIRDAHVVVMVQSTVALEAMAAGKPLIRLACFFPGAKMDIYAGVSGFLDVADPSEYSDALRLALTDDVARQRLRAEQEREVLRHMHLPDGRASERVASLIHEMATDRHYRREASASLARAMALYQDAMLAYYERRVATGKALLARAIQRDPYLIRPPQRLLAFLLDQCYIWGDGTLGSPDLTFRAQALFQNLPEVAGAPSVCAEGALADFCVRHARAMPGKNRRARLKLLREAAQLDPRALLTRRYWPAIGRALVGV